MNTRPEDAGMVPNIHVLPQCGYPRYADTYKTNKSIERLHRLRRHSHNASREVGDSRVSHFVAEC